MKIDQIISPQALKSLDLRVGGTENPQDPSFGDFLKNALQEVNDLQHQSSAIKEKLIVGEIENIHDVIIASEKANLAFQLTLQVKNKVIEAYQEIMRMQV